MTAPAESYSPPLVITVHGIRTHGHWQSIVSNELSKVGVPTFTYKYGFFSLRKFLSASHRKEEVERFHAEYSSILTGYAGIDIQDYRRRPSVIVHSFGSYIVGYCLLKYREIRFDKVILCGSILPEDFDWWTIVHRGQIGSIQNNYGLLDRWPKVARLFVRGCGASGTRGFEHYSKLIEQEAFDLHAHSDYFTASQVDAYWRRFLLRPPSRFRILQGRNIESEGRYLELLNEANSKVDAFCYGEDPAYAEAELPRGRSIQWVSINPDIYSFLVDRETSALLGYLSAAPVSEAYYKALIAGEVREKELTPDSIEPYVDDGDVYLYFMSVAIHPDHRNIGQGLIDEPFERLLAAFLGKLLYYKEQRRVRFAGLVAVAWRPPGRKLCEMMGMVPTGAKDPSGKAVYTLDFKKPISAPLARRNPAIRRLVG